MTESAEVIDSVAMVSIGSDDTESKSAAITSGSASAILLKHRNYVNPNKKHFISLKNSRQVATRKRNKK